MPKPSFGANFWISFVAFVPFIADGNAIGLALGFINLGLWLGDNSPKYRQFVSNRNGA